VPGRAGRHPAWCCLGSSAGPHQAPPGSNLSGASIARPSVPTLGPTVYRVSLQVYVPPQLALRPTAGQRTLDPLMVVRIHQGQLDLANPAPVCCSKPRNPSYLGSKIQAKSLKGRFKSTANSWGALGVASRHARKKNPPPTKPMSFKEASKLVHGLLLAWLRLLAQKSDPPDSETGVRRPVASHSVKEPS
jgi:hypothetical protein